ncbi:hypothetical protein KSS87_007823 [Heliosperma pusillum]|nr:hypothetical protein KSS87_007823 [Heliosperma pusillum]
MVFGSPSMGIREAGKWWYLRRDASAGRLFVGDGEVEGGHWPATVRHTVRQWKYHDLGVHVEGSELDSWDMFGLRPSMKSEDRQAGPKWILWSMDERLMDLS